VRHPRVPKGTIKYCPNSSLDRDRDTVEACRLAALWNDIEIVQEDGKLSGTWTKPAHSVKQGQTHTAPLNGPACQLLLEIRNEQTAGKKSLPSFVFPGRGARGHVCYIARVWSRLCRDAKIENMRMHDLRHSHATFLASGGSSLLVIGQLIGHRTAAATKRYAHLLNDPLDERFLGSNHIRPRPRVCRTKYG
jgi:integrase